MPKQYRVKCHETDSACRGTVTFNNSTFAVDGILPGETAYIELVYGKDRKSTTAKLARLEHTSPERREPFCKAFSRCGGCNLQHTSYENQLALKQAAAERLLGKFGTVSGIIGMENPYHYRHKIHATFFGSRRGMELGIYEENTHRVISVPGCAIQNKTANQILATIKKLADEFRLSAYNEDTGKGLLRHVLLRCGYATGQIMVVLVTGSTEFPGRGHFIEKLCAAHPEITTIVQNINAKKTSMVLGERENVLYGNGYIEDVLCGLHFRISPKSFYQVNPAQAETLYRTVIDFAGLTGKEVVLDAYCGTGTIGLIAAGRAAKVVGVESNAAAVRDARVNAEANGVKNAEFVQADATEYMRDGVKKWGMVADGAKKGGVMRPDGVKKEGMARLDVLKKDGSARPDVAEKDSTARPDVVILDPPRTGATEAFLKAVVDAAPSRVVYVSCNMETQARDVKVLMAGGYRAERVQPVDMFPWTEHVECVVLMTKVQK